MNIDDLLDKFETQLAQAFRRAINELTSQIEIGRLSDAIARDDINQAIQIIQLDESAFLEFERVLRDSYLDGGINLKDLLPANDQFGNRLIFRFDARNPQAEQFLRQHSTSLVTSIVEEQRTVIRNTLEEGLSRGDNPRNTALEISGRIDRRTGQREGGVIGLTEPQEKAVSKARQELESSNFKDFLKRAKRDKRFDRTLAKADREGTKLSKDRIDRLLSRYRDGLLKLRADTIGRTETLRSLHEAQYEGLRQLIQSGKVSARQINLTWDASRDGRTRTDHLNADGQMIKFNETFTVGGRSMKYPSDPNGGPEQVINCRCAMRVNINYRAN